MGKYRGISMWNMGQTYRHLKKPLDDHNTIQNGPECRVPEDAYAEVAPDDVEGSLKFVITLI